ncbi:hypothetical protein [Pseudomonas chlororaphis]|uniref:hypothetical protein n=2 Tax=Pseudomonas chlororaphis TaxID=587753 RepID=UPI0011B4BB80|nr:hypothetical protein [Pseudomonas chlororaphis]TWR99119.1 hypothetical protein FJD36_03905 [Pseudomonas chlororaphis subsp. chlororaphis]WDH18717.1 hypothetical protein PUP70_11625 [Pseudomonas chlororaphis]WDH66542.1 hypothetical protein PUP71_07455 [Pseudomonas chlororaphis]
MFVAVECRSREKQMRNGICGLCGQAGILKKSHLLPKSAYKQVRDLPSEGGKSPLRIDMQSGRFGRTDKQVDAHFLCSKCEHLFSKHGEAIVAKHWGTHHEFPLLEHLMTIRPVEMSVRRLLFVPNQLPEELSLALYYFAVSVFWRALEWPVPAPGIKSCKGACTGAQLEKLKRFLLNPHGYIEGFLLVADVNTQPEMNGIMSLPALMALPSINGIQFELLGIRFMMFVGDSLPEELDFLQRRLNRNFIIVTSDHSGSNSAKQVAKFLHDNDID